MHICTPCMSSKLLAYIPKLVGIFVCGTCMGITHKVDIAAGCIVVCICAVVSSICLHMDNMLFELYVQCGSHICSVIHMKYVHSATCHMVDASDFIWDRYCKTYLRQTSTAHGQVSRDYRVAMQRRVKCTKNSLLCMKNWPQCPCQTCFHCLSKTGLTVCMYMSSMYAYQIYGTYAQFNGHIVSGTSLAVCGKLLFFFLAYVCKNVGSVCPFSIMAVWPIFAMW